MFKVPINTHLDTQIIDTCVDMEELATKIEEIEHLNKKIINEFELEKLRYKIIISPSYYILEKEFDEKINESKSLLKKLSLKDYQLKKLELEIETQRSIAMYETTQHQEKNKELQDLKNKSAELENNLKAKDDELISKLRELSECKGDLIKYGTFNGNLAKQLSHLEKKYEDLESKFKVSSTIYQQELNSLKEQLSLERNLSAQLNTQIELVKTKKESLESRDLESKSSKTVPEHYEVNAATRNLIKQEIKLLRNKNSQPNQKFERVNMQLQSADNRELFPERNITPSKNQIKQREKILGLSDIKFKRTTAKKEFIDADKVELQEN